MEEDTKLLILRSIELSGNTETGLLWGDVSLILSKSSGLPRIKYPESFHLILERPAVLAPLSNLEIRCALCRSVVTYPVWYTIREYTVNTFHYFVCYDPNSINKPNTACMKRWR